MKIIKIYLLITVFESLYLSAFVSIGHYGNGITSDYCGYQFAISQTTAKPQPKCFKHAVNNTKIIDSIGAYYLIDDNHMNRLYGGSNAKYGESPWSVIIHYDMPYNKRGKFVSSAYWECGGTIIHKQWVLTAASCNFWPGDKDNPSASNYYRIRVQFMDVMRRTAIKTMTVPTKNVYRHPDYVYQSDTHSRYDIALYKLPWELDIDIWDGVTVPLVNTPVCLPNNASVYYNRELTTMFGWGVYNTYIYRYNFISLFEWEIQPDIMQKVDFVLNPHNECPEGLLCSKPSESMFVKPTGCDDDKGSALVQYTDAYRSRAILVGVYIGRTLIKGTKGCKDNTKSMYWVSVTQHINLIVNTIKDY